MLSTSYADTHREDTPKREQKRRKAKSIEKSSGTKEVVLLEERMTDPMHPLHDQARKAVERADNAYVGSPEQIAELVTQTAQKGMKEDLTVFGEAAQKAEKAGLSPEMEEEGNLIQDAMNSAETEETDKTWDDSPFSPGADL